MSQRKYILFIIYLFAISLVRNQDILFAVNLCFAAYALMVGVSKKTLSFFYVIIIPIFLATLYGIIRHPLYDVFKDTYYLMNPLLFGLIGMYFAKDRDYKSFAKGVILVATILSVRDIYVLLSQFDLGVLADPRLYRETNNSDIRFGMVGSSANIALLLLFATSLVMKYNIVRRRMLYWFVVIVNILALYLSGSRTQLVVFAIMCVILFFPLIKRNFFKVMILVVPAILIVVSILLDDNVTVLESRLLGSFDEISIADYSDMADINTNYRGWEAYMAMKTFGDGSVFEKMFGLGGGTMIDFEGVSVGGRTEVPILHNGYPYILVKTGIVGLFMYMLFYYMSLRGVYRARNNGVGDDFYKCMFIILLATIIGILITNMVISTITNPSAGLLSFVVGAILQYSLSCNADNCVNQSNKVEKQ